MIEPQFRVAGTLIIQNDEYVLQHRDEKPGIAEPGAYSLWGGMLESGELPMDGALRELKEETGLIVQPEQLAFLSEFTTTGKGPKSFGEPLQVYLYCLELITEEIVESYEGQGIIRLPLHSGLHPKLNDFAKEAIELYEAHHSVIQ